MTLEEIIGLQFNKQDEKLDSIIKKQEEKKGRDVWDKTQIASTILTGLLTLVLAVANLWTTSKIASQSQKQADVFHQDQIIEQLRDSMRKERDAVIQEINLLPVLQKMSKDDTVFRKTAIGLLEKIHSNKQQATDPLSSLAMMLKGEVVNNTKSGILYLTKENKKTNSTTLNSNSFWVYLGQKQNEKWVSRNFDIDGLPSTNTIIKSIVSVYQHDKKPTKIGEPDSWDLGKKIGVVKSGSTFLVLETLTLEDNNFWALVK